MASLDNAPAGPQRDCDEGLRLQRLREHVLVEREVGYQQFQAAVFVLQRAQLPQLADAQMGVRRRPDSEGRVGRDPLRQPSLPGGTSLLRSGQVLRVPFEGRPYDLRSTILHPRSLSPLA